MSSGVKPKPSPTQALCLSCGLCCNGVLFADVKLQRGDNAKKLGALGLPVSASVSGPARPCFSQPCAALDGCRCQVYADRPRYCREFECLLLKRVQSGEIRKAVALRRIWTAREQTKEVCRLLSALGNTDEHIPLRHRFQHQTERIEQERLDPAREAVYARLTLAFHDLNLLLSSSFYPGE